MVSNISQLISYDNEVFRAYAFWVSLLVLKMLGMSFLTGIQRFKNGSFANPEDPILTKKQQVRFNDEDVERVRRAHRNDMENILPFFAVGLIYVLISPDPFIAINLFRAVAISRIIHTFVYAVVVIPQPARVLSWIIAYGATGYMALMTSMFFFL